MSITINDGAKVLYQWDRGVKVTVSAPCKIVRVAREDDHVTVDLYPLVSGSTETVVIPDRMLSESGYLHISRVGFADSEEYVLETMRILVRHAAKPQTTAASTKEIADIQTIKMRMAALERAAREGKFDGEDGVTPHVGENGNWYLGENDTGVKAQGDDGVTPHVGGNGSWWLGDVDTGVKAQGEDGITPHIGENGNWYIGDTDTGVKATGDDGITPHIGENGNWYIGEEDTGVFARNEDVSLYADDMYTSGILEKGAMQLKILEPSGSNVIRYEIESAVVYIKGIRRARGGFTTSTQAVSFERLMANILRLNEEKGTFSWRVAEVIRDGDNLVNIDNGEIYPARSGGYYDLIPYLVRIPAGATSITYDMVEDLRADERYCGYVRDRLAPAKVSELENDAGYVTDDQIENVITTEPQELTDAEKVQARANIGAAAAGEGGGGIDEITSDMVVGALGYTPADTDDVPTKVSEIENDSGFITRLVSDLANYYDKSEVNSRLSQIPRFSIRVVSVLPTTNISETTVYLVKSGSGPDLYTEYIHVGGIWEILGSQRVDLTGYATEEYVIAYVTADRIKQLLGYTPASTTDLEQVRARAEVTPNLAQNDENADDYVKGRTHWREKVARVVVPAREKGTHYIPVTDGIKDLTSGKTYTVLAGGTEYSCTAYKGMVSELLYLGDSRLYDGLGNLNTSEHPENVPFLLEVFVSRSVGDDYTETDLTIWHSMSDERTTVSVIEPGVYDDGYRPIDDGYLPDSAARTDSSVMHDRTQNLDDGHKSIARKNIGALAEDQLPTAIDTALAQAKASGAFDGADGVTPHIGDSGKWFIGETDTGVNAHGDDGITPHIGDNGNWFIGDTDTGVKAQGKDGKAGMIDSIMTEVLYTDGVLVSDDEPDGLKVTYGTSREDSLCYNIERGAVIINGHAKSFNGVGSYFRDLNTDADQKIVFGYRYDAATGDIEQKIWYNCRPFITQEDGFPLRYFADGETHGIPAKAISGNTGYYDVLVSLLEIPAGATETTPEMFTDLRGIERFCGFVKSKLSEGVSEDELSAAVEDALEQAKASGDFKGEPGAPGKDGFFYGVCSTAAATVDKTVEIEGFELSVGAVVVIKFDNDNSASNPTLNVSGTGAKPLYRYGTTVVSTGTTTTGWYAGSVQLFVYDGVGWIRDYWNNSTYSNASLGGGYTTCSTAASTKAKTASLSSYSLTTGGRVSVKFTNAVPAGATLNIATKGAKAIYYKGEAITDGVIKAGDTATFVYSTYYHLISIDRDTYTKDEVEEAINAAVGSVGGGAGIDVTAEVGQTIVVKEVDASGKPTKWEAVEYQPRTHWDEISVILPETELEYNEDEMAFIVPIGDKELVVGQTYVVHYNGTEYPSVAQKYEVDVTGEGTLIDLGVILGNVDAMQGTGDTGEPFVLVIIHPAYAEEKGGIRGMLNAFDGAESVTLSIEGLVPHKIPEKYLPEDYVYEIPFGSFEYDIIGGTFETCVARVYEMPVALLEAMVNEKRIYLKCTTLVDEIHVYKSVTPAQYNGLIDIAYTLVDKTQEIVPVTGELYWAQIVLTAQVFEPTRGRTITHIVRFASEE